MLGPATMGTSIQGSKFKSAFGEPAPVARRLHPKKSSMSNTRKLISFFDSQRIDRANFYQPEMMQEGEESEMIDINENEARIVPGANQMTF